MPTIVFEYPLWLIPICIIPAAVLTWLLYYSKKKDTDIAPWQRNLLASLRFVAISIITLLLLSPFVQKNNKMLQKPIIVLAQDASESVLLNKDSVWHKTAFLARYDSLAAALSNNYEVIKYNFGQAVKPGFDSTYSQSLTDFSSLFDYLHQSYFGRNLGAVVVASDGIANRGDSPTFAAQQSETAFPVYTIALGDTVPARDLVLKQVAYNKITFQGANYPVELSINAEGFKNKTITTQILDQDNALIQSQTLTISKQHSFQKLVFNLAAKQEGQYHYRVEILPLPNELSIKNNVKDIAFEVLKSKQKILIVYNAPHPDIAALTNALKSNQNYSVTACLAQDCKESLTNYNLVFMHQLPSAQQAATALLNEITQQAIPVIFVLGTASDLTKFNSLNRGLRITTNGSMTDEVLCDFRTEFDLFSLDQDMQQFLQTCPPLFAAFGDYQTDGNARSLASQRIGTASTSRPLILFSSQGEQKTAFLCAEGWWRWRMYNSMHDNNFEQFDAFVNKIATFMAMKDKRARFKVQSEAIYPENEPVIINAELYNQSYELVNDALVQCTITSKSKKNIAYQFAKTSHSYTLNAGYLPVGEYQYRAQTTVNQKTETVDGHFSVVAVQAEVENTQANHAALSALSKSTSGALFFPSELKKLEETIRNNQDIVTISYENKSMVELVHTVLMFVLLVILLGIEWFLRKYWGQF